MSRTGRPKKEPTEVIRIPTALKPLVEKAIKDHRMKNHITNLIVKTLAQSVSEEYAEEIRYKLDDKNKYEALAWCINLDAQNQQALADAMGVNANELITTIRFLNYHV